MTLKVIGIYNGNKPTKEYILLQAVEDLQAHNYQIEDRTFKAGRNTNIYRHIFRFPELIVKKGEYIAVFTCPGIPSVAKHNGANCQVLYWGSNGCIWNDNESDAVELLKVVTTQFYSFKRKRA